MSSIKSLSSKQPTRQFVAVAPFNNDFFSYTTSYNPMTAVTSGTLSIVSGATASNCPAGRILREVGKKLVPGIHPGVATYMIAVFDSITLFQGYIDPDSPIFAVSNTAIPAFMANGVDPGPGGQADKGQPVYTNGVIVAKGQIRNIGMAGQRVGLDGSQSSIAIDASQGSFVFINGNGNNTVTVNNFNFGDRLYIQTSGSGNITFSTGFGVQSNNVPKSNMLFTFVCDGAHMIEQARSNWLYVY